MHRRIVVTLSVLALSLSAFAGCKKQQPQTTETPATGQASSAQAPAAGKAAAGGVTGEALYKKNCVSCHPDGGNPMNPKKTLHRSDLNANNIKTSDDIVNLMRNPGQGMTKFDQATISDDDAKKIGDYILATYK